MSAERWDVSLADVERTFTQVVRRATLPRVRDRLFAAADLSIDHSALLVLRQIEEAEPVRMSDLAQRIGLDLSTVSRQVATLEVAGLAQRAGDPADGRASLLRLSPGGRRALARLLRARREVLSDVLAGWSQPELADLAAVLERFAEAFVGFTEPGSQAGSLPAVLVEEPA